MQSQKRQNDLCSFPRQTIQYHGIQAYAPTSNAEEAKVKQFYEDLQDLLELTPPKMYPFYYWEMVCKVGNQETPGVTGKFSPRVKSEAGKNQQSFAKRMHWS